MDEPIERLAARQHGVFSRVQAFDAGVSRHRLDGLLRSGRLRRVHRCVYRLADIEATPFTSAMAAVLATRGRRPGPDSAPAAAAGHTADVPAAGHTAPVPAAGHTADVPAAGHTAPVPAAGHTADVTAAGHTAPVPAAGHTAPVRAAGHTALVPAASHHMAAALWQYLPAEAATLVDVSGQRLRRVPGVTLHRVRLDDDEAVLLRGVPVTSPARTILDLAGVATRRELEQALAAAERAHGTLRAEVRALLARRPRHRGSGHLRRFLAALDATGTAPLFLHSRAEEAALAMFRRARFPEPETNVRIAGHQVDFAWPALRLIVEVDGFEFHGSAEAFHRDRERDRDLVAAGYQVLRFTWRQLTRDADATLAALAAAIARRQDALAASRGA